MKFMTPCIIVAGALGMSMAASGCGETTADEGQDGAEDGWGREEPEAESVPDVGDRSGGATANAGSGGGCPRQTSTSVASHIVVRVSWPGSIAVEAGQGVMHLWTKADLDFTGSTLTGTARACGSVIPPLAKSELVGGGRVQVQIPGAVWEAPGMPVFEVRGTTSGFGVGAALSMEPVASLVGLTMSNPLNAAWPERAAQITAVDHDGDGRPGMRAIPRTDGPFSAPPVDLAGVLDPNGPRADEVDLAIRTVLELDGTRDSCTSARGTARVRVDSHVVGCHIRGGGVCTKKQADFVDGAQPRFSVQSATFEMVEVPAKASCADVRAALPAG